MFILECLGRIWFDLCELVMWKQMATLSKSVQMVA